jgi:signal transduction histidine kinase
MNLKRKLSLQSTLVCAFTLLVVFAATLYFYRKYTSNLFYSRLKERAIVFATIFLEKDELTKANYQEYTEKFSQSVHREHIQIYDAENKVVFVDSVQNFPVEASWLDRVRKKTTLQFEKNGHQYLGLYYKDNQGNYVIVVSGKDEVGTQLHQSLLWFSVLSFILGIIINYLLNVLLARRTFFPFSSILKEVSTISADNLHFRLDRRQHSKDELNELTDTLNMFLERLEKEVNNQRQFLKNVSHELNTPLSSVIGQAEVSLEKQNRSNEEYKNTLSKILKDATELKSILNGLLLLSGINTGSKTLPSKIRLDELLWEVLEKMKSRYPDAIISTSLDVPMEDALYLEVNAHHELLGTAMFNIIDNALKFSTVLEIDIIIKVEDGRLAFVVADKGAGIPPKEKEKIFELFFRGSNVRNVAGYGIGLSLIRQIAHFYNIDFSIESEQNVGTTVMLLFPPHS